MIVSLLTALWLTATPAPLDVVKTGNTDVQKIAVRKDATVDQLAGVVDRFVDFAELSRRALGEPQWSALTAAQRKEFTTEMQGLLRASYAKKALGQGRTQVLYGHEAITGNEASVATTVVVNRDRYPVDYKLYRPDEKGEWRIYDVVTDSVSLLETYQEQFRKLIASKGFAGLLATLKAKRAQLEKTL